MTTKPLKDELLQFRCVAELKNDVAEIATKEGFDKSSTLLSKIVSDWIEDYKRPVTETEIVHRPSTELYEGFTEEEQVEKEVKEDVRRKQTVQVKEDTTKRLSTNEILARVGILAALTLFGCLVIWILTKIFKKKDKISYPFSYDYGYFPSYNNYQAPTLDYFAPSIQSFQQSTLKRPVGRPRKM